MSAPTIEQVLSDAYIANGYYQWGVEGGITTLTREQLLPALEAAYDPSMENWPAMVDIEPETFTLIRRTAHGWTDQHGDVPAVFDTEDEARDASIELDDCWATCSDWKIIPTNELSNYDLVA